MEKHWNLVPELFLLYRIQDRSQNLRIQLIRFSVELHGVQKLPVELGNDPDLMSEEENNEKEAGSYVALYNQPL